MGTDSAPFLGSFAKSELTPLSPPSSKPFSGYAWVSIRNIQESGADISFTLDYAPLPPTGLTASLNSPDVLLSWTANTETDLNGYKVNKDDVFLAETTDTNYTDSGAEPGHIYKVTAVDASGNESAYSQSVTVQAVSRGGGGGCFIATVAYGSYLHPHVQALREFGDRHLLTNAAGRMFVRFYYRQFSADCGVYPAA